MKLSNLLALTLISTVITSTAFAQEKTNSVGPVVQFGGGSTAFGIQGKIMVSPQFSVRPLILFGYTPSVSKGEITQGVVDNLVATGGFPRAAAVEAANSPTVQSQVDAASRNLGTGVGYGLSATYDFKSPDSKIVGYVGPRILFGSASGSSNFAGVPFTVNSSDTNIGLTAGADYAISENFTAGLNATYNFSRSGTATITTLGASQSTSLSGGNFNFAINAGYNF